MDETAINSYITTTFEGVTTVAANGDTFFFYDPQQMFPFATLVLSNFNDQVSDLDRPGVFRLNIGVGKQTFQGLFGVDAGASEYDFTALDRLMPHPVYGKMYWVCILNPSTTTFRSSVEPLLAEAYTMDRAKHDRRKA